MKATILLVDDEQDAREPIRLILENHYQVLCASSGPEALQILEKEDVQLIIADQRMPQMTGIELLTRIRESNPTIVRLILTAYTDFDAMLQAINQGQVYRYIIKPWDVNDMLMTIRQALQHRELFISNSQLVEQLAQRSRALEQAKDSQESLSRLGRFTQDGLDQIDQCLHEILSWGDNTFDPSEAAVELTQLKEKTSRLLNITSEIRNQVQQTTLPGGGHAPDSTSEPTG